MHDLIGHDKAQGEWEIQLKMAINFISSNDSDETRIMHKYRDKKGILIDNETD